MNMEKQVLELIRGIHLLVYCWGTYIYLLYMVFRINKPIMVYLN
ncbi:hypothetical protein PT2222_120289 [Paraburkholderia tropica]